MLHDATPATDKRAAFSAALASGRPLRFPGAFNPVSAEFIGRHHFDGVYLSGAVLAIDLGLPPRDLTTVTELAERSGQIARVTHLPALAEAGIGSGEPMNVARTVQILEDAGVAGMHIGDQRAGDERGRDLVGQDVMVRSITAAVAARRDPGFVIAVGTGAARAGGLPGAIDRAKAYADAGADLICPGDLTSAADFERFRAAVDEPLLADLTGSGRGQLLDLSTQQRLGINVVIYPVLLLQLAMTAVGDGLAQLAADGTQERLLDWLPRHHGQPDLLAHLLFGPSDLCVHDLVG